MRKKEVKEAFVQSSESYKATGGALKSLLGGSVSLIANALDKTAKGVNKAIRSKFGIDLSGGVEKAANSKLSRVGGGLLKTLFKGSSKPVDGSEASANEIADGKLEETSGASPPGSILNSLKGGIGNIRDDLKSRSDKQTFIGKTVSGIKGLGMSAATKAGLYRDYNVGDFNHTHMRGAALELSGNNTYTMDGINNIPPKYTTDPTDKQANDLLKEVDVLENQIEQKEVSEHEAKSIMFKLASRAEMSILQSEKAKIYYEKMEALASQVSELTGDDSTDTSSVKSKSDEKKKKQGFFSKIWEGTKNLASGAGKRIVSTKAGGYVKGLIERRQNDVKQKKLDAQARLAKKGKDENPITKFLNWMTGKLFGWPGLILGGLLAPKGPLLKFAKYIGKLTIGVAKWIGKKAWAGIKIASKWLAKKAWAGLKWLGGKVWTGIKDGTKWLANKAWEGTKWLGSKVWEGFKWVGTRLLDLGKNIISGLGKLLLKPFATIGKIASKVGDLAKNTVTSVKNMATGTVQAISESKVGKWAKSAWSWGKGIAKKGAEKLGQTAVGQLAKKGGQYFAKHGLKVIAKQAFKRIATGAALLFSGPVGWAIAIGFLLWDAYDIYKFLKGDGEIPDDNVGNIIRLRLLAYGLNESNKPNFKKIFELEEVSGPLFRYDTSAKEVVFIDPSEEVSERISGILGTDGDEQVDDYRLKWFGERFLPTYKAFLTSLWAIDPTIKPGNIDQLDNKQLASLVYGFDVGSEVFDVKSLPYPETITTTVTKRDFDELLTNLKNKLKDYVRTTKESTVERTERLSKENTEANRKQETISAKAASLSQSSANKTNQERSEVTNKQAKESKDKRVNSFNDYFRDRKEEGNIGNFGGIEGAMDNERFIGMGDPTALNGEIGGMVSLPEAIATAAQMTGVPEDILWTMAKIESSLNPNAKAKTSSASGLFQFIDGTWKEMIGKQGKKYGLTLNNANRFNPLHSAIMAGEYIKNNLPYIKDYKKVGIDLGTAAYLAHFAGPGGVRSLFGAYQSNPNASMSSWASPSVYKANRSLMEGKSIGQFIQHFVNKYKKEEAIDPRSMKGFKEHESRYRDLYQGYTGPIKYMNDGIDHVGEGAASQVVGSSPEVMGSSSSSSYSYQAGSMSNQLEGEGGTGYNNKMSVSSYLEMMSGVKGSAQYARGDSSGGGGGSYDSLGGGYQGQSAGGGGSYGGGSGNEAYTVTGGAQKAFNRSDKGVKQIDFDSKDGPVKVHPIKEGYAYYVSSLFGPRNAGVKGSSKYHQGVDFAANTGVPVVATADGKVARVNPNGTGYGKVIYISHPGGWETRYAHLSQFGVRAGQDVKAGDVIGYVGNTGVSGGPHLHYEIRKNDVAVDPMHFEVIQDGIGGHKPYDGSEQIRKPDPSAKQIKDFNAKEAKESEAALPADGFMNSNDGAMDGYSTSSSQSASELATSGNHAMTSEQLDASVPKFENTNTYKQDVVSDGRGLTQQQLDSSVPNINMDSKKANDVPVTKKPGSFNDYFDRQRVVDDGRGMSKEQLDASVPQIHIPPVEVDISTASLEKTLNENTATMKQMSNILELLAKNLAGDIANGIGGIIPKQQPKQTTVGFDRPGALDVKLNNKK